jgi:outer membrane protein TolC
MDREPRREAVHRTLACVLALLVLGPSRATRAEPVTFDEAIFWSEQSPAADAPRRALAAREDGDATIGGTAQALSITAQPGARVTPDEERGFEGQFTVTQGWNLAGLGRVRREAAASERSALAAHARAVALAVRLEAARLWIELHTFERLLAVTREQLELARETQRLMTRAAEAGVGTLADVAAAEALASEMMRAVVVTEGHVHQTSIELSRAMGREATSGLRTAGPAPAPELPGGDSLEARVERVSRLPRVSAIRLAALAARAREREAHATMGPLVALGAQIQNEPPSAWTVMGNVGLVVQPFDRGMRARSMALAEAAQSEAEHAHAQLRAQAELRDAIHDLEHARRTVTVIDSEWLPAVMRLVERRARALAAGEGTAFAWLSARKDSAEVQALLVRALGAQRWAEVRLWLLLAAIDRAEDP